jgi:hypothetical protein
MSATYCSCFLRCWQFMSKEASGSRNPLYTSVACTDLLIRTISLILFVNATNPVQNSSVFHPWRNCTFIADTTYKAACYPFTAICTGKRTIWKIVPTLILAVRIWRRHNSSSTA